ncbi:hypothetical protein M0812_02947 [Anaeramoeba flamelloides]|uniref:Rap-GAP domain-containing protein n=1 Tax=Anaeramoeba flamelloides TaxID=1746091 RepID=A0AAV7YR54_9EUKA|nr:hypothetical protein M0812_02947 [Anaeramoeba flamelloides]
MFGHLSLIFQPRKDLNKDQIKKHIDLCEKVITIYEKIQNKSKDYLDHDTWKYLLNTLLGIIDSLLIEGPVQEIEKQLSKKLIARFLKVFFDLWLISKTRDLDMWDLLQKRAKNWIHRKETINQWCATIYGLTNRVIGILYGEFEGTISTTIALPVTGQVFQPSILDLPDENVIFDWEKIIYILGNPNRNESPELFYLSMNGIFEVVTALLNIGTWNESQKAPQDLILNDPPNGNSILKLFGRWIFQVVSKNRAGFEKGTAVAYSILCDIFCSNQKFVFLESHINEFILSIILAFENEKYFQHSISSIITHTENIFLMDFDGLFLLIPYYLKILKKILLKDKPPFKITVPLKQLRRSSINIVKSLVCLPNYFFSLEIPTLEDYSQDLPKNFQFITFLRDLILSGFTYETDPTNAKIFLHTMIFLLYEIKEKENTMLPFILLSIQKFICQPTEIQKSWPIDIMLTAIYGLHSVGYLTELIEKISNHTLPNLVNGLNKVFIKLLTDCDLKINQQNYEFLICGILNTICNFIVNSQWIYTFPAALENTLESISHALIDSNDNDQQKEVTKLKISDRINYEAHAVLLKIIRHCGNFPLLSGPSNISCSVTEETLLEMSKLSKEEFFNHVKYFILNEEQILTVIDYPFQIQNENITYVIIRDISGRYSWKFKFRTLPINYIAPKTTKLNSHLLNAKKLNRDYQLYLKKTESEIRELGVKYDFQPSPKNCLSRENEISQVCLKHILSVQYRLETAFRFLKNETGEWDQQIKSLEKTSFLQTNLKYYHSRLLLSNTGLMKVSDYSYLILLDQSEQFFEALKVLDECAERTQQKIGVVYISEGQNRYYNGKKIFENTETDEQFNQFLKQIGWIIDLEAHTGYTGGLNLENSNQYVPYYANYSNEVIFQVSTLMGTLEPEERMEKIHQLPVVIVWCNDNRKFNSNSIKGKKNQVFIIVRPHHTGLFKIEVQNHSQSMEFSPFINNSLISTKNLGSFIRIMAMNIHHELSLKNNTFKDPFENRRKYVNLIATSFGRKLSYDKFFSGLFTTEEHNVSIQKKFEK